jgi:hypothetical protein
MNSSKGIACTGPDWIAYLEAEGIGYQQYVAGFISFIDRAIASPQGEKKSLSKRRNAGPGKTKKGD